MIFGIGTDVCDVRRIRDTWSHRGERFAERVLGPQELKVFRFRLGKVEARGISYLATRFSAKEAFSKAIGLGLHMPMSWRACEILNLPSGQPVLRLHGALAEWFAAKGLTGHVTVSDETDYATSFVVVETLNPPRIAHALPQTGPESAPSLHAPVVLDIAGTALTADDRRRLRHPLTGGLILFARHWQDRRQLTELVADIKSERPDLLVCVDHEGGRVQRFRSDGFTHLPPMRALGELWMRDALTATDAATAVGHVLGAELRACGVDLSFTPVLDLDFGSSSVIGDRAFHRDPRVVTMLAKSLMHGLLLSGMANCGKHFPGHGHVKADSHVAVPVDKRSLRALMSDDARPYEWLGTSLASVMPAHVVYPKVDHRPAGYSARWLKDILRLQLGFNGAIFSDDLSMEGARYIDGALLSYTEAAVEALNAGCDMVLLCNQSVDGGAAVDGLLDGLSSAQAQGLWEADPDSEHRRTDLLPRTPPLAWDELMHSAAYQHALERLP